MKKGLKTLLITATLVIAQAAVGAKPTADFVTIPDLKAADATEKRLLGQPRFTLAKVYVVRLAIDGHPVQATSLVPAFFRGYEPVERGFNRDGRRAFSLITFSEDRSKLVIYTRDPDKKQAYKLQVPLEVIEATQSLSFPFAHADGSVKPANFAFNEVKSR